MAEYKSGEALIEILNARGVDKIFLNPGFEFIDVLSSVAAARAGGGKSPQLVLCLDESAAASAAYGNYMVTGNPQVVMVHSELGTLQLGGNLQNLQWGRVPVVILAAYQEADSRRALWNGTPYDQGAIVRNSVKYDRRLIGDEDLHEVLAEAFRVACSEPTGPVYLCFPMGYLYRKIEKPETQPVAGVGAADPPLSGSAARVTGAADASPVESVADAASAARVMSAGNIASEGGVSPPMDHLMPAEDPIPLDPLPVPKDPAPITDLPPVTDGGAVGSTDAPAESNSRSAAAVLPAAGSPPPITPSLPAVDMQLLEIMADTLVAAKNPMIVSGNAGRFPENVKALESLAETLSASVLTGYSWMNFPGAHPLCVGVEQIGGSRKKDAGYDEADVILVIDYAMPYVGSAPPIASETTILHIDVDPLTQGRLLWGRGADVFMKAGSREAIPALEKLLSEKITPEKRAELDERFKRVAARNEETRRGWYESALAQSERAPISADYLCYCINSVVDDDTIIVNHTLSHCASATEQIPRVKPKTWFGCPSGAIGWAPGAALGAASAATGGTVVAIMTDGGFVWGCPTSVLWTSANYRFPFLAVICNNRGYGAIRNVQLEMLGEAEPGDEFRAESAVDFQPDYAQIARGAGAFSKTVIDPKDILPALKEALSAVRNGKPAVLDVHLGR